MQNNNVYLYDTKKYSYDFENIVPSKLYNELKDNNLNINSDKEIYDSIRNILMEMELDKKNIGTNKWNPFADFIKKGDNVLIKPNLVMHFNKVGTTDSLITNFSIIRPIIDYTILALGNTGSIIVGDAPVQDCDFLKLSKINNLEENINKYKKLYKNISLIDFRRNSNPNIKFIPVNLTKYSSFNEVNDLCDKFAITNYDLTEMRKHHNNGCHEYLIPQLVLDSDVIINLPKPKCHRKAGMTACCKNFVGINGSKEWLPHHRIGSIHNNGDEYPESSFLKKINSKIETKIGLQKKPSFSLRICRKISITLLKTFHMDSYKEGSWYGNDTIHRTLLDINKLIIYANKKGIITNKQNRTILNICDMIISGEKEGPLLPTDKKVGYLVAGFNQLNTDYVISKIMGFNYNKLKFLTQGYKINDLKLANNKTEDIKIISNVDIKRINKHFIPSGGWKNHL